MAGGAVKGDGLDLGAVESVRRISGSNGTALVLLTIFLALSGPSLSAFQTGVVAPLGSTMAERFGGGDHGAFVAQLAMTFPGIGVMFGGPLCGWLLPRIGLRPTIIGSALLLGLGGFAGAFIQATAPFLATRLLVGLGAVGLYTSLISLTAVFYSGGTLARMLSYQTGLSAATGMVLILIAGNVAESFGWQASFSLYLFVLIYALIPLLVWLPDTRGVAKARAAEVREPVSIKPFIPLLLLTVIIFAGIFLVVVQGSLLLSANGIKDPSTQAIVISGSTFSFAIFSSACAWIERRVTGRFTLAAGLCAMGVGASIMGLFASVPLALLGSLTEGAGSGLASTFLFRAMVERASGETRDRVAGFILPSHYLGQVVNPFIMQGLRTQFSIQTTFVIAGGALILGSAVALFTARRRPAEALTPVEATA